MKIISNRNLFGSGVISGFAERCGIAKSASTSPQSDTPIPEGLSSGIHANKVASAFSRTNFTASSNPSGEDKLTKVASLEVGKQAMKFLKASLKENKIGNVSLSVQSIANPQYKVSGVGRKTPTTKYADVIIGISHPTFPIGKVASCVVSIYDGKPQPPATVMYDDSLYDYSREGWTTLLSDNRNLKTASSTSKHVVIRKYSQVNPDGTVTNVPGGYYESLGKTDDPFTFTQELKRCGVMSAQRVNVPAVGNAVEPLLTSEGDLAKVNALVSKYCQVVPDATAVVGGTEADSKRDFVTALRDAAPGSKVVKGKVAPGNPTSVVVTSKSDSTSTSAPIPAGSKTAQVVSKDKSFMPSKDAYYERDFGDSGVEGVEDDEDYDPSLDGGEEDSGSLDALIEKQKTKLMRNRRSGPDENFDEPDIFDEGEADEDVEEDLGEDYEDDEDLLRTAAKKKTASKKKTAARKSGTPWSEGSNDSPTQNKGPASGGKAEVKGPGGTQKLTRSGGARKAPAEMGRERSVAWDNGGGSESRAMQSMGVNAPPTKNRGPASGGVSEVKGPGGTQKLWDQKGTGQTSKPHDRGTSAEFLGRDPQNAETSGKTDQWFDRDGSSAEGGGDKFWTHENSKPKTPSKDFWGETPKAKSTGSMSPLMKGSSIQKYACGPHQAALRARLMRSRGFSEEVIAKESGVIGGTLGGLAGTLIPIPGVGSGIGGMLGSAIEDRVFRNKGWGETAGNALMAGIPGVGFGAMGKGLAGVGRGALGKGLTNAVGKGLLTDAQAAGVTGAVGKGLANVGGNIVKNKGLIAGLGGTALLTGGGEGGATPAGTTVGMGVPPGSVMPMQGGGQLSPQEVALFRQLIGSLAYSG